MGRLEQKRNEKEMSKAYLVKIDAFEGPLDLLLHLIGKYEIDIYDIPVAEITGQYMQYIHKMQYLELNIASEYLVMAATLLAMKSKMLLPKPVLLDDETELEEDPREELVERLIEYRKYKSAAGLLKEKETQPAYTRSPAAEPEKRVQDTRNPAVLESDVYDLLGALGQMLDRKKWKEPQLATIQRTEIPIRQRMKEIIRVVNDAPDGVLFDDLFEEPTKSHIVATFLALLELIKEHLVQCRQEQHFSMIRIFKKERKMEEAP